MTKTTELVLATALGVALAGLSVGSAQAAESEPLLHKQTNRHEVSAPNGDQSGQVSKRDVRQESKLNPKQDPKQDVKEDEEEDEEEDKDGEKEKGLLEGCFNLGGAHASGVAAHSPGVLSGNVIQIPVDVPINLCGNSINIIGLLNPAF